MELHEYQRQASQTDHLGVPSTGELLTSSSVLVPLLGLAGEVGELLSEYKKALRDGHEQRISIERIGEELGDLLWYLATTATKFEIDLEDVAAYNLAKTKARWDVSNPGQTPLLQPLLLDDDDPTEEQFPRRFEVHFNENGDSQAVAFLNGQQIGDPLDDNSYEEDGYRFHDVFHLAYAAVLGWSPVTRKMITRKRKSQEHKDRIEDGGRAAAIEEGIAAMVFAHASSHNYYHGGAWIETDLLRTIKATTASLEVSSKTTGEWETAIRVGFHAWQTIYEQGGGCVTVDLVTRTLHVS